MVHPGKNQQVLLNLLMDADVSLPDLYAVCVPNCMDTVRFDTIIGTLLRRGNITCAKSDDGVLSVSIETFVTFSRIEMHLLSILVQSSELRETLIRRAAKHLRVHENAIRMAMTRLKKRGCVDFINSPQRSIEITQAGIAALGARRDIQN